MSDSGWISIKDGLPFVYQQVLVWTEYADGTNGALIEFYNGEKRGFVGVNGYKDKFVTHWMPMPNPPDGTQ